MVILKPDVISGQIKNTQILLSLNEQTDVFPLQICTLTYFEFGQTTGGNHKKN